MLDLEAKRVLVVAPHPDDEVFGCGGLIYLLKQQGVEVHVLFMTVGTTEDFSPRGRSTRAERLAEVEHVAAALRFDSYVVAFAGDEFHLRLDALPRHAIVHALERTCALSLERLRPDIVLAPSSGDYNQDHQAAYEAVVTALRPGSREHKAIPRALLTYELPYEAWSLADARAAPSLLVPLTPEALNAKLGALELYRSQLKPSGPVSLRAVDALARYRGLLCGHDAAEAFHVKRLVL